MALIKKKYSEIPPDAVVLTEDDAINYQTRIMKRWKHPGDVFAFKYGAGILGGASLLVGMYINNHFRHKLHLYNYGRMSSYLPICAIPAAISIFVHTEFVLKDIVIQKTDCAVCVETRAAALQAATGMLFPLLLAPAAGFSLAIRYTTYEIPSLTGEPRKVLQLIKKIINPAKNIFFAIFVGQALLAAVVTFFEVGSIETVHSKLRKLEYELEHSEETPS